MGMIDALAPRLGEWARADDVLAVVIRGEGERAFCAGGDVRDLYRHRGTGFGPAYYAAEYKLNVAIHNFPKHYIALMDGVTMGGGAGLSVHGSHSVQSGRASYRERVCP